MTLKPIFIFYLLIVHFYFSNCTTPPEQAIVKRWKAIDMLGRRHEMFLRTKETNKGEIEFTKEGKCNMYTRGIIEASLNYTMATDGKSFLLSDPADRESVPVEIVGLTSDKLMITSKIFQNDTAVFKVE